MFWQYFTKNKSVTGAPYAAPELARAFCNTDYYVCINSKWLSYQVGHKTPQPIRDWIQKYSSHAYAWQITAHNPNAKKLKKRDNNRRHKAMQHWLQNHHYPWLQADSSAHDKSWPPELGFFILNMDKDPARALGRHFGQKAIVLIPVHGTIELIWI